MMVPPESNPSPTISMDGVQGQSKLTRIPLPIRYAAYKEANDHERSIKADNELLFVQALVDNGALGLQRLMEVKNDGWEDEATDQHFSQQRQRADTASTKLNGIWVGRMKNVLREIDLELRAIPENKKLKFLDLGCSPGGFSLYVLENRMYAKGVGVSLSPEDGGHDFCLGRRHRSRYKLHSCNLTYLQLGPSSIPDSRLKDIPLSVREGHFDLVLLDGHQLRTQVGSLPWDHDRLLISQLILALRCVKEGGTIIVKLPLPHILASARVLIMLKYISSEISAWKPTSMHANRGTFYAVAKGVGTGGLIQDQESSLDADCDIRSGADSFLRKLQELWVELTFGGEEGRGRNMRVVEDMDFVATMKDMIDNHLDWLIELGTPLWNVQEVALEKLYAKNKKVVGRRKHQESRAGAVVEGGGEREETNMSKA